MRLKTRQRSASRAGATRRRDRVGRVLWCGAVLGASVLLASATWAFQPEEPAGGPQGLQGIMPGEIPRDLDFEAFTILGPNWEAWGEAAAEEVATLYAPEGLGVQQQRELIAKLRQRLRVMDRALNDQRYRMIHDQLTTLAGRLQRRVDIAEAVLNFLEQDPAAAVDMGRLAGARSELYNAVNRLHDSLSRIRGGAAWFEYVRGPELLQFTQAAGQNADAVPVAAAVLEKLQAPGQARNDKQRQFLSRPEFGSLRAALANYVAAAPRQTNPDQLREQLAELVAALEDSELNATEEAAARVRAAYRGLRTATGDRLGPLAQALRRHYFNYNLQVVATEQFLNRIVADMETEGSPVRDCILGASITGYQCTSAFTSLNLLPAADVAMIEFNVDGTIRSNTAGSTRQATVYTAGFHTFRASKNVLFDGNRFLTEPARVGVDVNTTTTGIRTRLSGWPILGRIANRIAQRRVAERTPQAQAITRGRIAGRVSEEMNREVATQLAEQERKLNTDFHARLRSAGLYPESQKVSTTEDALRLRGRTWDPDEIGGSTPSTRLTQAGRGATIHLHESLLNHAADQMNFRGRTMTNREVRQEVERYMSVVLGRQANLNKNGADDDADDEEQGTFAFVERDPLRFRVTDGQLLVTLRAGLQRPNEEPIPPQVVTIPYSFRVEQGAIVTVRGTPTIEALEEPDDATEQVVRAGVMRRKIEQSLDEETRRDRKVMVERRNKSSIPVWVTRIKAVNGWITVWAE